MIRRILEAHADLYNRLALLKRLANKSVWQLVLKIVVAGLVGFAFNLSDLFNANYDRVHIDRHGSGCNRFTKEVLGLQRTLHGFARQVVWLIRRYTDLKLWQHIAGYLDFLLCLTLR